MAVTTGTPSTTDSTKTSHSQATVPAPVVLDLGKQRRKQVKQLRKGSGKLMEDINDAIEELRTAGTVAAMAQPVVVIVREKRRRMKSLFPLG